MRVQSFIRTVAICHVLLSNHNLITIKKTIRWTTYELNIY